MILLTMLAALAIGLLARTWGGREAGFLAGIVLASSWGFLNWSPQAMWDGPAFAGAVSCAWALERVLASQSGSRLMGLFATLTLGFSFFSKGPVGLQTVLFPFLLSAALVPEERRRYRWRRLVPILVAGIALGAAWWIWAAVKVPGAVDVLEGEARDWGRRHLHGLAFYFFSFPQAMVPWSLLLLVALPHFRRSGPAFRRAFWWALLCILFLSVVPTKKVRFLLPLTAPAAILLGIWLQDFREGRVTGRWVQPLLRFHVGLMILGAILGAAALVWIVAEGSPLFFLAGVPLFLYTGSFLACGRGDPNRLVSGTLLGVALVGLLILPGLQGNIHTRDSFYKFREVRVALGDLTVYRIGEVHPVLAWELDVHGRMDVDRPPPGEFGLVLPREDAPLAIATLVRKGFTCRVLAEPAKAERGELAAQVLRVRPPAP